MIVLLLILAHLLGDFVLQTDRVAQSKTTKHGMIKHVLHHVACVFVAFFVFYLWQRTIPGQALTLGGMVASGLVIVISHGGLDLLKIRVIRTLVSHQLRSRTMDIVLFIADQLLHSTAIFIVSTLFLHISTATLRATLLAVVRDTPPHNSVLNHVLIFLIVVILVTYVSGMLVQLLTSPVPEKDYLVEDKVTFETHLQNDVNIVERNHMNLNTSYIKIAKSLTSRGKQIGYLERLLMMILVYNGSYYAIGFIIAAKSLVRFRGFEDREWAEYFLVGTLSSTLFGVLFGYFLHWAYPF